LFLWEETTALKTTGHSHFLLHFVSVL
jgi:hypothetical protein